MRKKDLAYVDYPSQLKFTQLPTYKEVGLAVEYYKTHDELSEKASVNAVTADLINIYQRASIPTIHEIKIYQKINKLCEIKKAEQKLMLKNAKKINKVEKYRLKAKNGKTKAKLGDLSPKLFDIAKDSEVPVEEKEFLEDQRRGRKMIIGGKSH